MRKPAFINRQANGLTLKSSTVVNQKTNRPAFNFVLELFAVNWLANPSDVKKIPDTAHTILTEYLCEESHEGTALGSKPQRALIMKGKYFQLFLTIVGVLLGGAPLKLVGGQSAAAYVPLLIDLRTYPATEPPTPPDSLLVNVMSNETTGDTDILLSWVRLNGPSTECGTEGVRIPNTHSTQQSLQDVCVFGPAMTQTNVLDSLDFPTNQYKDSLFFYLDPAVLDICVEKIKRFHESDTGHTSVGCTQLLGSILSAIGFNLPMIRSDAAPNVLNEAFIIGILGKGLTFQDGRVIKRINMEYDHGLSPQSNTNVPNSYLFVGRLKNGQPTGPGRAIFEGLPSGTYIGPFNGANIDGDGTMYFSWEFAKSHFIGPLANGPTTITQFASPNPAVLMGVMVDGKFRGRVDETEKLGRKLWWTVDTNDQTHVDLARVTLGTQTGDDDQDHNTGLWVEVIDKKTQYYSQYERRSDRRAIRLRRPRVS